MNPIAKLNDFLFGRRPVQATNYQVPEKIYIERTDNNEFEYSENRPAILERLYSILNGYYSKQNFIELFNCVPEIFAPIHEIASRVADCNWQLCKEWNDEVDYGNEDFNRLFTKPNPLQPMKKMVYQSVVYEILTGAQFWYFNKPDTLVAAEGEDYKNILAWWNLTSQKVVADMRKGFDPYSATEVKDFVMQWKEGDRTFPVEKVLPILHLGLECPFDLNIRIPLISGADKALKNLIPVYEARGIIYIKRGALGFIVSRKVDNSGSVTLTPSEKKAIQADYDQSYGLSKNKSQVGVTSVPVDFVKTSMSIEELQPFDETLSDAVATYAVLRVPRHLVPSKDQSTYANADADMKSFYENVIIPWAERYAEIWNNFIVIPRRYINVDYSHIPILQENRKTESEVDKIYGDVWLQRWQTGTACLNDWITSFDGIPGKGNIYELKLPELTPEEIDQVKAFINLKAITPVVDPNAPQPKPPIAPKPKK